MRFARTTIKTPLGYACIEATPKGISHIYITDQPQQPEKDHLAVLTTCAKQLKSYFSGTLKDFDFPVDLSKGTAFQQKVWQELRSIPYGKTLSYLDLAKQTGNLKAVRAVAAANGKNPLWVVIPCHRVIGTDGSLTGYAGGLWRKRWLLEHEGFLKQQRLF